MRILFLAAEAYPISKVGGLGDVAGSLPQALAALGHEVRVVIPFSGVIDRQRFQPAPLVKVAVPHIGGDQLARISEVRQGGVVFNLIAGPPIPRARRVYGDDIHEDGPKFIFFSLAALGLCRALEWAPDVVHAHDSHTGAAVYWLGVDGLHDSLFQQTASVFTIHNLMYMNTGAAPYLREYGLAPSDSPLLPDWARDSLMGLGLAHADMLSTVSPGYAREILTPEYGYGLEGVLQARRKRLVGILNGLDLAEWDPAHDRQIAARFEAGTLARRAKNKRALQQALGLPLEPRTPLVGIVSRLDTQKGFDLAGPALRTLLEEPERVQAAVLGSGLPAIEAAFKALARDFPTQVGLELRFDARLARQIYAGADMILVPSRYEPCGLAQMIAQRSGAVPIVRRTGGLADTVVDAARPRQGTGFMFAGYNSAALLGAVRRALRLHGRQAAKWQALQRRGLRRAESFGWAAAAEKYVGLYSRAIHYRKETVAQLAKAAADLAARA
ncbi:MAG: glycogen synthase [Anaerolineales bacterium]